MAEIKFKMDVRDIPKELPEKIMVGNRKIPKPNPNFCEEGSENKEYVLSAIIGDETVEFPGWTPEESFRMLLTNMQMHEPEPDFLAAIMEEAGYVRDPDNMIVGWSKKPKPKKKKG